MGRNGMKSGKSNTRASNRYNAFQSQSGAGQKLSSTFGAGRDAVQTDFSELIVRYSIVPDNKIDSPYVPNDRQQGPDDPKTGILVYSIQPPDIPPKNSVSGPNDPNTGILLYSVQPPDVKPLYGIDEPDGKPKMGDDRSFFRNVIYALEFFINLLKRFGKGSGSDMHQGG